MTGAQSLRLFGLAYSDENDAARVLMDSALAGLHLVLGAAALLLSQLMVYLAFGLSFAIAAFGRLIAALSSKK